MTAALAIYSTQSAPAPLARWLQGLLQPVLLACYFERGLPLEVRPTGSWAGWCASPNEARDGRVSLSNQIVFWTNENIVSVYLHEATHRLLEARAIAAHGPEFFCLNALLLLRSAAFFRLDPLFKLGFYDFQDAPAELENEPDWRGVVLNWALPLAAELAATDTGAEEVADIVCARWRQFAEWRENARATAAQQVVLARKKAVAAEEKIEALQSSLWMTRAFLCIGWFGFLSVVYFVL